MIGRPMKKSDAFDCQINVRSGTIQIFVMALTAALLVSGCIGIQSKPDTSSHTTDLTPDPGHGSLSGLVVTEALEPLTGAEVRILNESGLITQAETDHNGQFEIKNLQPGSLIVQVAANCCRESSERLILDKEDILKFTIQLSRLTKDELQIPYVEKMEWNGFLSCTARWIDISPLPSGYNICGLVDGIGDLLVQDSITDDDFMVNWTVRPGLKSIVGGMTWQNPAMAMGDELEISLEPDHERMPVYARASGSSPLEWRVDEGDILATYSEEFEEYDFSNLTEETILRYRVFAAGDLNVVYQQKFTVYWDLYYWAPAPPAATVLPDS